MLSSLVLSGKHLVGPQLDFCSYGTTSLLLIAYHQIFIKFGVHLRLNFLHIFPERVSSHAESCRALCHHGAPFVLGKTCVHLFWNWSTIVAQLAQNDTPALGEGFWGRALASGVLSIKFLSFEGTGTAGMGAQYSWPGMLRVELLHMNGGWVEITRHFRYSCLD